MYVYEFTVQYAFDFERNELLINNWQKVQFACFRRIWFEVNHAQAKFKTKNILLQIFALNKTNLELALVYTMTIVCR